MQEEVVDVVGFEELKATFEHCLSLLKAVLRGREVGELCGNEVLVARVAACFEGDAKALLALAATVGRRCVEVVDTVVECVFAETVDLADILSLLQSVRHLLNKRRMQQ